MVSNKILAVLVGFAILLTAATTLLTLSKLDDIVGREIPVSGRATSQNGNVTFEVSSEISIILNTGTIDFGSGFVNTSNPACANNATLVAAEVYNDSGGNDCWTGIELPRALTLENDGNVNVTLDITGPNVIQFFTHSVQGVYTDYSSNDYEFNLSWKMRNNETGACNEFGDAGAALLYRPFTGSSQNVCDNFDYYVAGGDGDGQDEIAIDVEVKIPSDLYPGLYENTSIVFSAAAAS